MALFLDTASQTSRPAYLCEMAMRGRLQGFRPGSTSSGGGVESGHQAVHQ